MSDIINVVCVVLPDGTVFWFELGEFEPEKVIAAWKERLPAEKRRRYESDGVTGGFVLTRMLLDDYKSIPATSQGAAVFAAAAG